MNVATELLLFPWRGKRVPACCIIDDRRKSITRMICYNVYIPLLMRQANDVEENSGPSIFDVINPMKTVSADYRQGNEALFGENAVPKLNPPADKSFDRLDDRITANMDPCYKTGESSIDSVDVPVIQSKMKY
ncbi:uncharacterized protein [Montipora foliosa]|uniref:uncharacterized protein n=1 Tax=Montipora foliosa TaxID=591990 RepID=UPI0035F13F2F